MTAVLVEVIGFVHLWWLVLCPIVVPLLILRVLELRRDVRDRERALRNLGIAAQDVFLVFNRTQDHGQRREASRHLGTAEGAARRYVSYPVHEMSYGPCPPGSDETVIDAQWREH